MRELCFCLETDRSLGLPEVAARVLARLSTDVVGPPDRYGRVEPLRERFDPAATDAFVEAWCDSTPDRTLNSLHFRRRSTHDGAVLWWTSRRQLDSVHFTFFVKPGATASIMARLALAQSLFDAVDGQYGYLCDREEYYARCVVDAWPSSSGRLQGGRAVGTDRRRHLPALFWANFFGPAYGALLGASRFAAAPAYETTKGTRSWRLLTAASPTEWKLPSTLACIDGLRAYLGGDLFYSREHPDRPARAPSFALAKATPCE